MANRVIRDSIFDSPSQARLSREADAWFPRWVLMADDWGCFKADPEVIKGTAYPRRKDVTEAEIGAWAVEYYNNGQLFLWMDGERLWGFFTAFQENNPYLQKQEVDNSGRQIRARKKSPEPPKEELSSYLKAVKTITRLSDIIRQGGTTRDVAGQRGTGRDVMRESVSVSESGLKDKDKSFRAQKTKAGADFVENSVENSKTVPPGPQATEPKSGQEFQPNAPAKKPRSPNQSIQDGEIEAVRKLFAEKFGGQNGAAKITEAQICRLAFGASGDGRNCFEALPVLAEFLKSLTPKDVRDVDDPFRWLMACAKNPETVERAKRQVYSAPFAGVPRIDRREPERVDFAAALPQKQGGGT